MTLLPYFFILIFWVCSTVSCFESDLCAQLASIIDSKQPSCQQAAAIKQLLLAQKVRCKAADMLSASLIDEAATQQSLVRVDFIKPDGVLTLSIRRGYIHSAVVYSLQEYAQLCAIEKRFENLKDYLLI